MHDAGDELKAQVKAHWEHEPCGTSTATAEPNTSEFFDQVERERYRLERFAPATGASLDRGA